MRILAAQINPIIGDLNGNTELILKGIASGLTQRVELVVFPEMSLCGYPPEDFILLPHFIQEVEKKLIEIVDASQGIAVIVGLPRRNPHHKEKPLCNSAALIYDGKLVDYADKILLPTYDIFDERRYFEPGHAVKVWELHGQKIGVIICEDLWHHAEMVNPTQYHRDPILELSVHGISCLINLSASPYHLNKHKDRLKVCLRASKTLNCPVVLCNQVGGNDSLIFDGSSLYVSPKGLLERAQAFKEDEMLLDLNEEREGIAPENHPTQELYQALVLGVRDYFNKLGFQKACLGLSGGIDSAVVACIAVEALGAENVLTVGMPSQFSSVESMRDAALLAQRLGIEYREISIEPLRSRFLEVLNPFFEGLPSDTTEENLQARIRGVLLMSFSNKFGYLVLSTGNKSEFALGYSTLYGDMCGGLAVIGDVTKRKVYQLARWINRAKEVIPAYTIDRPPSAELSPNQKDSDTLPDYDIIDNILEAYVEEHREPKSIADRYRYHLDLVESVIKKIHANEYKRRQAPPALRVSEKAFSVGRRFPIVQRWV